MELIGSVTQAIWVSVRGDLSCEQAHGVTEVEKSHDLPSGAADPGQPVIGFNVGVKAETWRVAGVNPSIRRPKN